MNRGLLNQIPVMPVKNYMVSGFALLVVILTGMRVSLGSGGVGEIAEKTTVKINSNVHPGGSGVIIDKVGKIYTVLTANHVVCDGPLWTKNKVRCATDATYTIQTNTGREYPIKDRQVLQKDECGADLATVTFEAEENYSVAILGNSDQVKRGADVIVAGFPAIFGNKGKDRTFNTTDGKLTSDVLRKAQWGYRLVYNAQTSIGNSGGPVFDAYGRVVGIHGLADIGGTVDGPCASKRPSIRDATGQETGVSSGGKTGFNAGVPINTFFSLTGRQPPTGGGQVVIPPPPVAPGDPPRRPTRYKAPTGPAVCPGTVC
ncbi:peptidase S1 [Cylindrospermopsis raciborskii CENA303]|uniref:Peptidase S1 n=2 Tax=Cylindrospermopsis raciborskii TaxID=77022 RepID=A0A1X4G7S2_9CYAN|nr:peptidase S1 [Cylindrospermopsis raciborskii CENA303]